MDCLYGIDHIGALLATIKPEVSGWTIMRSKKTLADHASRAPPVKGQAMRAATSNITMQKIAELAGVSAMTVSRALKNDAAVSPPTRRRVLEVVKETGYVTDATARVFASVAWASWRCWSRRSTTSNFADHGMSAAFESAGLQILLGDTGYSIEREEET